MNKRFAYILDNNYIVYEDGRVFNVKTNKEKKFTKSVNGYMVCQMWINGKSKMFTQHRLLAKYFIDNPENKTHVNHKNGIKHDNKLDNLEWCTHKENVQHSFDTKLRKPTIRYKKLIDIVENKIYESMIDAAIAHNVCREHLWKMLNGKKRNTTNLRYYNNN